MKYFSWIFCCCCAINPIKAQNLIPNSGFELRRSNDCEHPVKAFEHLLHWYRLDATPDLFINNCLLDESGSVFYNRALKAYQGNNFVGLSSRWNSNGTYVSEGIATPLTKPLEAGKTYYFQMAIRNRGGYQGFDAAISRCNLEPNQHIDIYLAQDSITINNNFANGTASTTARLVAVLETEVITSTIPSTEWTVISTCFEALGGETYLGIILPLGTFGALPPCAASASSGVFRSFYYNLDEVKLTSTPDSIIKAIEWCENELLTINLLELLDTTLLKDANFVWQDGVIAPQRNVTSAGTYQIEAISSCGTIPITINILPQRCLPTVYVPNAFSPNQDGINDNFVPFIDVNQTILNYQFTVFNRWGNMVFKSDEPKKGWDGTFKNSTLSAGTYFWHLQFEIATNNGNQIVQQYGDVLLIQ